LPSHGATPFEDGRISSFPLLIFRTSRFGRTAHAFEARASHQKEKEMVKKAITGMIAVLVLFNTAGLVLALEKGNNRKGEYPYRKLYQACMERGEVASAKPPVNPDAKTRARWTGVFEKRISRPSAASRSGQPFRGRSDGHLRRFA
jgi:hypothetical protein